MTSARGAALKMQLRSRKRDFASSAAVTNISSVSPTTSQKKRAVKSKSTSQGVDSVGQKVDVVAPTSSKFPVLTALKQRVNQDSNDPKILLKYPNLVPARLIRRYKRFLADVVLLDGTVKNESVDVVESKTAAEDDGDEEVDAEEVVTVYCPNTGPMIGLLDGLPNARVQLSKSSNPKRKYSYTLEMIQIHVCDGCCGVVIGNLMMGLLVSCCRMERGTFGLACTPFLRIGWWSRRSLLGGSLSLVTTTLCDVK